MSPSCRPLVRCPRDWSFNDTETATGVPCRRGRRCLVATGDEWAPSGRWNARSGALRDHLVDQAIVLGLLGRQEIITRGVALDALERLAGLVRQDLVQDRAGLEDLVGVDL